MTEIYVPRQNPNDDQFVLVEWTVEDGSKVHRDDLVAVIETSKVAQEINSPADGFLHQIAPLGQWCPFDRPIGIVTGTKRPETCLADNDADTQEQPFIISKSARALAEELGVSTERIATLGKKMIGAADIKALAAFEDEQSMSGESIDDIKELWRRFPEGQRTVAAVVSESHKEIPSAFVARKVDIEDTLSWIEANNSGYLGLTELLVQAVAAQQHDFPACFRTNDPQFGTQFGTSSNVAITFDVGQGLKLPVIRDAREKSLRTISAELLRYRVKAARGTFESSDFAGSSIMISLNFDTSVLFSVPIIFPGLSCVVSVGDPIPEVVMQADGQLERRRFITIGLAYDHRFINGRDANAFIRSVDAALKAPIDLGPELGSAVIESVEQ